MSTHPFPKLSPEEAAALIRHNDRLGFGGFTIAGNPRTIATALSERARAEHAAGREFQIANIGVATGALDGLLAPATTLRTPFQSNPDMRARINRGECQFFDPHLSWLTQAVRYGFLGHLDWAIVQAAAVTPEGGVLLTSSVGGAPTYCSHAARILIELNRSHPESLLGVHDIYEPADPPHRREIPIFRPSDRIGSPLVQVDPRKIAGVVECAAPDEGAGFEPSTPVTEAIGRNVADFLAGEIAAGRVPGSFLPVQSGVGNVANSVLGALGGHPDLPPFEMYTEIIQDAVVGMMECGRVRFASCCALTLSAPALAKVYGNLEEFRARIVLRPQEITNHPEVVRRLGVISINTALEADLSGNVNSTHLMGSHMMNGIGGSGDFTRNAYLSIFTTPSVAKEGRISALVPMVAHPDHTEHDVQILATEWGVADLRGRSPRERARLIIDRCAHPDYREALDRYLRLAETGHTAQTLREAFRFHERFEAGGDMRPGGASRPAVVPEARL